ncbi:hypothetical protein K491DRAFT_713021 [Lophiostoma macrostomum CBS 122681]|uniref:Wings apart-like protein C-terminal domain-containing protein n=1 Tax=Lophiostoma macrostomum CBS 122681 TaxID=1314788 RepID=A0A6A6THT9_9PLEO|nr:hypothetical protein K491DRAFT_713021 [Lophiostoma macrostomum CBS 122681]
MSSAFTTADRRKRIATYGRSSRPATSFSWNEEAPSPERPRKLASAIKGTLRKPAIGFKSSDTAGNVSRTPVRSPSSRDVFDVPSDDDLGLPPSSTPTTAKKLPRKVTPADDFEVTIVQRARTGKTPQHSTTLPSSRAKSIQPEKRKEGGEQPQGPAHSRQATARAKAKETASTDIFDVPLSDEDAPLLTPRKARHAPFSHGKTPNTTRASSKRLSSVEIDSDDSSSSRKRKRQESSQPSVSASEMGPVRLPRKPSVPTPHKSYQKERAGKDAGENTRIPSDRKIEASSKDLSINKPKRTRVRTAPTQTRIQVAKGQSSPAKLHGMLAVRSMSKPATAQKVPDITALEDETMYDIHDPSTPVARSVKSTEAGSVTPRQAQLFSSLLDDTSKAATPGMPSIRRLQLSDRKPASPLSGLTRSSSDIPQTTFSRKSRLIDTLRQATIPSEEEESSESEEESEEDVAELSTKSANRSRMITPDDDMDVDEELPNNSQASQSTLHLSLGTKVTYGQQRSYLEEANPEDNLLMSMDFDTMLGSQKQPESETEDESSQVRGIHELRRQGQNQKFQMEAQTAIDDIAAKSGISNSVRRSTMLDLCARMADDTFLGQLLESALGHQFLASIRSKGEIIFDFAATVAIAFILKTEPGASVLDAIYKPSTMETLTRLLAIDADISRIAKERKTNMSNIGKDSVASVRALVQESALWSPERPEKVSPQFVALRTLDLLVLALRNAGNTEAIVTEQVICQLLKIALGPSERLKAGKPLPQDLVILNSTFSILEAVSMSNARHATWSNEDLARLLEMLPVLFDAMNAAPVKLALRLCMNLTNNKPKACEMFAQPEFVQPLVRSITNRFDQLTGQLGEDQRTDIIEALILSLGAMINLAEFSDHARLSVVGDGNELVDALARIFLEGSERAALADSVEETHANVTVGYLTVLLGNLCLNDRIRNRVRSRLPGQSISLLINSVKEFVRYHERVDRLTSQFEGQEGQNTWKNYTARLLLVVERLEKAEQ